MEAPKIIVSRFELYPQLNPHSYCVGFTCGNKYIDTLIPLEKYKTEDYYVDAATEKLKDSLIKMAEPAASAVIGRQITI